MTASVIVALFSCTAGTYFMLMCCRTNININISVFISILIYGIHEVFALYAYKLHSIWLHEIFIFIVLICIFNSYTAWNMEFMIKYRKDFYWIDFYINGYFDM